MVNVAVATRSRRYRAVVGERAIYQHVVREDTPSNFIIDKAFFLLFCSSHLQYSLCQSMMLWEFFSSIPSGRAGVVRAEVVRLPDCSGIILEYVHS